MLFEVEVVQVKVVHVAFDFSVDIGPEGHFVDATAEMADGAHVHHGAFVDVCGNLDLVRELAVILYGTVQLEAVHAEAGLILPELEIVDSNPFFAHFYLSRHVIDVKSGKCFAEAKSVHGALDVTVLHFEMPYQQAVYVHVEIVPVYDAGVVLMLNY